MRRAKKVIYSHEDWNVMEHAHRIACRELNIFNFNSEEASRRVAKRVMTLFDYGLRDENMIAAAAARQERFIAETLSLREKESVHLGSVNRSGKNR